MMTPAKGRAEKFEAKLAEEAPHFLRSDKEGRTKSIRASRHHEKSRSNITKMRPSHQRDDVIDSLNPTKKESVKFSNATAVPPLDTTLDSPDDERMRGE